MGTRADFYVGKGKDAEWLGSIAWDGYETSDEIDGATNEADYRAAVSAFLASRDDATLPDQGWPWPWNDSGTTDCSYAPQDRPSVYSYMLEGIDIDLAKAMVERNRAIR